MRPILRLASAFFAALLPGLASPVIPGRGGNWPGRPGGIIGPVPAGRPSAVALRRLGQKLAEKWAQPVLVENRQGADGIPAVSGFLGARDDHSLLFSFPGIISINPYLHDALPYDPNRDLVPIVAV